MIVIIEYFVGWQDKVNIFLYVENLNVIIWDLCFNFFDY